MNNSALLPNYSVIITYSRKPVKNFFRFFCFFCLDFLLSLSSLCVYYNIFFCARPFIGCKPPESLGKSPRPRNQKRDRKDFNDSAYLEHPHVRKGSDSVHLYLHMPTSKSNKFNFFSFFFTFFWCAFINGRRLDYVCLHYTTPTYIGGDSTTV